MSLNFNFLLVVLFFISFIVAQPTSDRITSIPLLNGKLGVQYSGYLNINATTGKYLHYVFVTAQENAKASPVVLWMNGGPGCSSFEGYIYENGPFRFHSSKNLSLVENPHSWNKVANMLYLEAPVGVGFSYSNTPSDYNTNDFITAADNYQFLQKFFAAFPSYQTNSFYISGESYAGIYIPTLAKDVLDGNKDGKNIKINLKGVLTGNGVTNSEADDPINSFVPFTFGHSLISNKLHEEIVKACKQNPNGDECNNLIYEANNAYNDIDPYDIYSDCFHQRSVDTNSIYSKLNSQLGKEDSVPCVDSAKGTEFLNREDVKKAYHVRDDITWTICSNTINYQVVSPSVIPIYEELLNTGHRVLIYSGDADGVVPTPGSEYWTTKLIKLGKPKRDFDQWFYNDEAGSQVGGFVTEYTEGLTFVTVRGAGHMVPQTRPKPALEMLRRFLAGRTI